jgi:hypothetical protein
LTPLVTPSVLAGQETIDYVTILRIG